MIVEKVVETPSSISEEHNCAVPTATPLAKELDGLLAVSFALKFHFIFYEDYSRNVIGQVFRAYRVKESGNTVFADSKLFADAHRTAKAYYGHLRKGSAGHL